MNKHIASCVAAVLGVAFSAQATVLVSEGCSAADKTYEIFAYAQNDIALVSNSVGTVYSGALTLTKVKDADEYQCKAGEVMVSRANADPYPLTINYTLTSSAEGAVEGTTWEAPVAVTIPAGEKSATLALKPIIDATVAEDITVTLALAAGNYELPAENGVDLTLANLVAPAGYNTWVAAAEGKASDADNWSNGVPQEGDKILFDGRFSNVNCEWDGGVNGLTDTVSEWAQSSDYTGKVTVDTMFPGAAGATFTCLTVTGDMTVAGGSVIQRAHTAEKKTNTYRLRLTVGGKLTVAAGASISAYGKGSYGTVSPFASSAYGGGYDGANAWGSLTAATDSVLDLNGTTLTVKRAKLGTTSVAPGTYDASSSEVSGFITDSVTGGSLVVTGAGLRMIVR